ncbi:MAG: hypothetical protein KAS39_04705, partial [Actinomycetia bacterium]|nr:hypothetical protein [Actinomycetes bacterium]
ALEGIKKGIISKPTNRTEYKKKWEVVRKYFDAVYKKDLGLIFIKRVELDETVKIYRKALWKYYQFLKNRSKKPRMLKPFSTRTNVISTKEKGRLEEDITDDDIEEKINKTSSQPQITRIPAKSYDRKEMKTAVIPRDSRSLVLGRPDSDVVKIDDILIPMIGDVFKSLPNTQIRNAWIDLIKGEKVITDEEREKIDLKTEDILDVEALISSDQESEEHKKQKEKYTGCLISNLENMDSISAKMEVVVKFKNSSSNSIINDVHTIYEILLKREKKINLIKTQGVKSPSIIQADKEVLDGSKYSLQSDELETANEKIKAERATAEITEGETELEAALLTIGELDIMSAEADGDSDIDTDEIGITIDFDDLTTQDELADIQDEESTGNNKSTELKNINEIIAKILSSMNDDENYKELGQAFGGSKYLSPSEMVDEITKQAGTIEEEQARNKIQEILEASQKILEEIEPLPSDVRKITKLNFWISDDYTDKPHMQKFLEGQIIEHENNKGSKEQLLSNLFREVEKFDDPEEKIRYLNGKHDDPAYRHLKSTIETIIENIQKEIDLEPENISKEWIDSELAGTKDPDASLNWLTIRRHLPSYSDLADHIDMKTAEIEETLEEDTFTECVKASLDKKEREGKKPAIYKNIISLTRAALILKGPGKRQSFIKEQEILAPYYDGSNNLFKKQRKLIFYLMSTASNEGNIRLKALADRVSMSFKEKQEYLKILKLSKYKDKAENIVTLPEELNITDENIAYYAVYILGFNKPLEERIRYIENFRDENTNDSYAKYKESYNITMPLINKVI